MLKDWLLLLVPLGWGVYWNLVRVFCAPFFFNSPGLRLVAYFMNTVDNDKAVKEADGHKTYVR